jgi:hypothetical protein
MAVATSPKQKKATEFESFYYYKQSVNNEQKFKRVRAKQTQFF